MALRLAEVIQGLVSDTQTAFVKNRNITDGILVANEIVSWFKEEKKKCALFKIDFQKAYDSVKWSYLEWILGEMGFVRVKLSLS